MPFEYGRPSDELGPDSATLTPTLRSAAAARVPNARATQDAAASRAARRARVMRGLLGVDAGAPAWVRMADEVTSKPDRAARRRTGTRLRLPARRNASRALAQVMRTAPCRAPRACRQWHGRRP